MPSIVTLDIFSGRENPSWVVDDDKVADLQRVAGAAAGTRLGPLPILGYRGFHVRPVDSEHAAAARLEGLPESAAGAGDAVIAGQREAEEYLLSTAAEHIDEQLRAHVRDAIARGPDMAAIQAAEAAAAVRCPPCHAHDAPAYNPNFWNTPQRQPKKQLLQLRQRPGDRHLRPARPRDRPHVHRAQLPVGPGRRDERWLARVSEFRRNARSGSRVVCRPGDLAERRLPLVPAGQGRLLVAQARRHESAQYRQLGPADHRPENL